MSPPWSGKDCIVRAVRVTSPPTLPGLGRRDAVGCNMETARYKAIYGDFGQLGGGGSARAAEGAVIPADERVVEIGARHCAAGR